MKKQLIALLLIAVLACGVCLAACNTVDVLESYVFNNDGQAVYDDFVLPNHLGDDDNPTMVKWTSDNEAIKLTERENDYLAEIVFPDKSQEVTLTVSANGKTKSFTVTVNPLAASDFSRAYVFPQLRSKVAVDFDLDTTFTYKGKTATISWEVVTGSPYITVNADGNKCIVDHQDMTNSVSLRATFKYGTDTKQRTYDFTVAKEPTHEEAMHRWHTIAPMDQDLPISGYVVAIAEDYSSYGNASFYMVCEDYCSAYYVYRAKADATEGAKLDIGKYVTVTGTKNKDYNGLFETDGGGKFVVDEKKTINVNEHIYAFDNDLFAAAPTADYHVSAYVSLTNWEVKSIATSHDYTKNPVTVMTITKNGVDIPVNLTKYLAHHYTLNADDQTVKDVLAFCSTVSVGDHVTVKGIMGKYKSEYQLSLVSASDLAKTTADAADKVYPGLEVKDTVAAVKKAIADNKLESLVTTNKTVTMPAGSGKVTVVYSKYNDSNAVAINENVITVTPGKKEDVNIKATIKYGDEYETMVIFNLASEAKTDAEMVAAEKDKLTLEDVTKAGDVTLPSKGTTYTDVTIEWAVKTGTAATVEGGKLKVATLPAEETTITLTATLKKGDVTETKDVDVKIAAAPSATVTKADITNLQEGKAYKLMVVNAQVNKTLYITNKMNGYYIASTEDLAEADDIYVEKAGDGYKLYFLKGETKNYLGAKTRNGGAEETSYNISLEIDSVWTITADCIKTNLNPSGTNEVFVGTNRTNTTFSVSAISYLPSTESNFAAYLVEVAD